MRQDVQRVFRWATGGGDRVNSMDAWLLGGQCARCYWLRRNKTCRVFRSRLDVWPTLDGGCQAHATREQADGINAGIRIYLRRERDGKRTIGPLSLASSAQAR